MWGGAWGGAVGKWGAWGALGEALGEALGGRLWRVCVVVARRTWVGAREHLGLGGP